MAQNSPKKAWEFLKKEAIVNGQVINNVHVLAHLIGNNAYNKLGFEGVKICSYEFAYGCIHGVTEQMFKRNGISGIKTIEAECLKIWPPQKSSDFTACIHGAGHGLLGWRSMNIQNALRDCDLFSSKYSENCYDGVYMEYSTSAPKNMFGKDDNWGLCNMQDLKYQIKCAKYQTYMLKGKFGLSYSSIIKQCKIAPSSDLYNSCILGLGQYAVAEQGGDFEKVLDICMMVLDKERNSTCLINAAQAVAFQQYMNWQQTSERLCRKLSDDEYKKCQIAINGVVRKSE